MRRRGRVRGRRDGRHRPLRQPPHPRRRRAHPEPGPHGPVPSGPNGARAHDDPGGRGHHAVLADQHPADRRCDQGVLRHVPALAVHGPEQSARGSDAQAPPLRAGPRRALARPRGHGGARRPPLPLRPHVPDRDARRPEHRSDRLARVLRAHQLLRLHRDALPAGRRRGRHRRDRLPPGRRRGPRRHRAGRGPARRGRTLPRRGGPVPHARRRARSRAGEGDRLHGRLGTADVLGRNGHDPLPGARRRQPRPHGGEHAAPGRSAHPSRRPLRGHGHGDARRGRRGRRDGGQRPRRRPGGRRRLRSRRAGQRTARYVQDD